MPKKTIIFQLATQYLAKKALRLECLFNTIQDACFATDPIVHHYALNNIFEIMEITTRPELKSRFLKELIRVDHALSKSTISISNDVYASLYVQIQVLSQLSGVFGYEIHQDVFLQAIKSSTMLTRHETNELEIPQLLFWLTEPALKRQEDLSHWFNHLKTLHETIKVYLSLLRDATPFESILIHQGYYQQSLSVHHHCALILLKIDRSLGVVPKMQFGHHGLSLRLCDAITMREINPAESIIELAICRL